MATFKAARLSEGNKLFPAEVTINEFGVTLKISGLFSGKEQSMSFDEISSVKIDTPMIGYSSVVFDTLGYDRVKATGFSKADVTEMRELIQKAKRRVPMQSNNSHHSGQQVFIQPVESEAVQLARIEQENRKIQIEQEEQLRRDAENTRFMLAIKKHWKIWLPISIIFIILMSFLAKNKDATKASAKTKNFEIEQIEDQVKLAIANKNKEKALLLVNQLVMTEHEIVEGKGTLLKTAYYDLYWDEKREFYKEQIISMSDKDNDIKKQNLKIQNNSNEINNQSEIIESSDDLGKINQENEISNSIDQGYIDAYTGKFEGEFGNSTIEIDIQSIQENGKVMALNIFKGNTTQMNGIAKLIDGSDGIFIELKEPQGSSNGVFNLYLTKMGNSGTWKSYNGKLQRDFKLDFKD